MSSHGDFVTAAMFEWTVLGKDDRPLSHHFTATEKCVGFKRGLARASASSVTN